MRIVFLLLLTVWLSLAQPPPAVLPAFNTVTGTVHTCTFEANDSVGSIFVQCRLQTGTVTYTAVVEASEDGAVTGHGEVMCLYWTEAPVKFRLQCAVADKLALDGYIPQVVRKRRWFLLWR